MKHLILASLLTFSTFNQVLSQKESLDDKMGRIMFETIQNTQGFYDNEELLILVKKIGGKLEAQIDDHTTPFKYHLVDVQEPNAFATAGGYVYVTRGLLALLQTEDELAAVLGHEFAHVTLHHPKKAMYRKVIPAILEMPANILGTLTLREIGQLINLPIELTSKTVLSVFDRQQETEADHHGIQLAEKAGYDPRQLAVILTRLQDLVDHLTGEPAKGHLFDDHPMTSDRVTRLYKWTEGYQPTATPQSVVEYLSGLVIDQNAKQGIVDEKNGFYHPGLEIFIQLPDGWLVQNTPSAITAMDKTKHSAIVIGLDDEHGSPREAADKFKEEASRSKKIQVEDVASVPINSYTAEEVLFAKKEKRSAVEAISAWVQLDQPENILQIIASSDNPANMPAMMEVIMSLRPLTERDWKMIVEKVMRVEVGTSGQTLEVFVNSKENGKYLPLLEIYNAAKKSESVAGKTLKYIQTEQFIN